jgi:pimeloyl-ACP methyl ester carboxylesterase
MARAAGWSAHHGVGVGDDEVVEPWLVVGHCAKDRLSAVAGVGRLSVPVLASGGAAQTLAANYGPMCEEVAIDVISDLVPDAGHWVAEENPDYFCRMFIDFDTSARTKPAEAAGMTPNNFRSSPAPEADAG